MSRSRRPERVHDLNAINLLAVLEIFGQQYATASLFCRSQNQGIPKGKSVQPVKVDGGKNVSQFWRGDIKLRQNFDLAPCDVGIDTQLSCNVEKVLLKHLQGNNATPSSPVFCYEVTRTTLFRRCRLIVGIEEDVSVEKTTNAHEPRRD